VRVEHGVTYHGIALNVTVRLSDFDLIDACGMPGVESTSIDREMGRESEPSTDAVAAAAAAFAVAFASAIGAPLRGSVPPYADPAASREELETLLSVLMPEPPHPSETAPSAGPAAPAPPANPRLPIVRAN
jgi:hypothetical protein